MTETLETEQSAVKTAISPAPFQSSDQRSELGSCAPVSHMLEVGQKMDARSKACVVFALSEYKKLQIMYAAHQKNT